MSGDLESGDKVAKIPVCHSVKLHSGGEELPEPDKRGYVHIEDYGESRMGGIGSKGWDGERVRTTTY